MLPAAVGLVLQPGAEPPHTHTELVMILHEKLDVFETHYFICEELGRVREELVRSQLDWTLHLKY